MQEYMEMSQEAEVEAEDQIVAEILTEMKMNAWPCYRISWFSR